MTIIETSDKRPRFIGGIVVLITFGLFGSWSLFAPLQKAVLAPGIVALESNRKTIQHLEGGIVSEILVSEGSEVSTGDPLVRLDDTQIKAQLDIARFQLFVVTAKLARLQSEQAGWADIRYPVSLSIESSHQATNAMAAQTDIFVARQNAHRGEVGVFQQRIEQLNSETQGIESLRQSKLKLVVSYTEEIADYQRLLDDGFAEKTRLRELQRKEAEVAGEAAELLAEHSQVQTRVGETQLQILQLKKDFQTSIVSDLDATRTAVYDYEERVNALADRARKTLISSPVSGRVLGLSIHTVGGVIGPGDAILELVSGADRLIIDAQVSPMDIDQVTTGQLADIRFSAFSSQTTPVIEGEVINLSADVFIDEQRGSAFYLAKVRVTSKGADMLNDLTLLPGMPTEVLITTGSRTFFEYLSQPIRNSFARSLLEE